MPIYKPTELRLFLQGLGIQPRKGLSQNFLIDGNIIRNIVAASHVEKDDIVLEVGPGPGSLTEALLQVGANVVAVEKDQILSQALARLNQGDQLSIFCDDIMEFPFEDELKKRLKPGQKAKLIANLPYHLTTPILARFVQRHDLFSSLTVMVQEEVARRFVAQPNTSEYSSFTLYLSCFSKCHYAFTVSRNCFYPVPNVDSAVVVLNLQAPPESITNLDSFFELTRTAFNQRRKMLRASLKGLYTPDQVTEALTHLGLDPLARPEQLSRESFIQLYLRLNDVA